VKVATALTLCRIGAGLTTAMLAVEFCAFYLHLFVLPVVGMPFTIVLTLAPSLAGISVYQRALKADASQAEKTKGG
jgi:UPF0716 family protein affecting phage T7 exclusion